MAISFVAAGTTSNSTTTVSPGLPAGLADGDLMQYTLEWRSTATAPAAPSGWTLKKEAQVTHGVEGAGSGTAAVCVYERVFATGDTAPSISVSGRNGGRACIVGWHRTAGTGWQTAYDSGTDSTPNTTHSAPSATDLGGQSGDVLTCFTGTNGVTIVARTGIAASWAGCTLGTVNTRTPPTGNTTSGNDLNTTWEDVAVSSGTSSGAPSVTWTWSGTPTTDFPVTAAIYTRLREQTAAAALGPQPLIVNQAVQRAASW